jgi:hypothetical protein
MQYLAHSQVQTIESLCSISSEHCTQPVLPMAGPAFYHNIYHHHQQHTVLNNHDISFEKGWIACGIVAAIGINLKIRTHFQWPILSFVNGGVYSDETILDNNCCVMV